MYFTIVRELLDDAIPKYAGVKGIAVSAVDMMIASHIAATSDEHNKNPDPDINYDDYLCRLGYLYVHAGANGCLFERTVRDSDELRETIRARAQEGLSVCSVGGGPGTELLGLYAFLQHARVVPAKITFTVLDGVQHWSETWRALAKAAEKRLAGHGRTVALSREFQTMDVTDPNEFDNYAELFGEQDILVFNYLLSENKVRFTEFNATLAKLLSLAKPGARFVFIDRIEYSGGSTFADDVESMVRASGLAGVERTNHNGCMAESDDELASYIPRFGRRPRRWFRTVQSRWPTAFSVVGTKPGKP